MDDMTNEIFRLICEKYQKTLSDEIIIEFPFHIREKRTEIGNELKNNKYITKFDSFGKCFFRCTITQKVMNSFTEQINCFIDFED